MVNRLKNALWLIVGAVAAVWALTTLVGVVQGGPMEPPAAPGPTNRMAIYQPAPGGFPIVISQPGSYYLGENINGEAAKDGIHIRADNVTLDLNGFTLKGAEGGASFNGITVPVDPTGIVYNLSIFNGTIRDWGNAGIGAAPPNGYADYSRLADLSLKGNGGPGVRVGWGSIVSQVTASYNGGPGILAGEGSIVERATVDANEGDGIYVSKGTIMDSVSRANDGAGIILDYGTVTNCTAMYNEGDGIQAAGVVMGNEAFLNGYDLNDGAGIHVYEASRIEGNDVQLNDRGVDVDGNDNIIIRNSAYNNTTDYDIAAGNTVGQIINMTGGGTITADPWANFRY